MIRESVHAVMACVVTFVVCAIFYPAAVWALGRAAFPHEAEGSLIRNSEGVVIGSELIAQPFASEKYFQPRPSAVDYKADATGGSNLGTKNPDLRKKIVERADALKSTADNPVPVDLVMASGAGMDPHITPEGAFYQVARVALARKMSAQQVRALIERSTERSGTIIGAPARVNVLKLNLELDGEKRIAPMEPTELSLTAKTTVIPGSTANQVVVDQAVSKSPFAEEVAAIRAQVVMMAKQVQPFGERIEAMRGSENAQKHARDQMEAIERKLSELLLTTRKIGLVAEAVDVLEGRVRITAGSLNQLGEDVRNATRALKAQSGAASTPARRAN